MLKTKQNKMSAWLLSRPALFAVIAFFAMTAAAFVASAITGGAVNSPLAMLLITVAFIASVVVLVRMLPAENLDRRSFVALNNAQMVITSGVFISSTLLIVANARTLMMRLLWLESHSGPSFMIIMIAMALFYLYLCGIYIGNLYAKYRRIRAMGMPVWKTLATAPFGFCMLWIPGYLMDEKNPKKPAIELRAKWYARVTDWVLARPVNAAATLVGLIVFSGFFFGFSAILLTLAMAVVFTIWAAAVGTDKMREKITGPYSTVAVVLNIVAVAAFLTFFVLPGRTTPQPAPYEQITITETVTNTAK